MWAMRCPSLCSTWSMTMLISDGGGRLRTWQPTRPSPFETRGLWGATGRPAAPPPMPSYAPRPAAQPVPSYAQAAPPPMPAYTPVPRSRWRPYRPESQPTVRINLAGWGSWPQRTFGGYTPPRLPEYAQGMGWMPGAGRMNVPAREFGVEEEFLGVTDPKIRRWLRQLFGQQRRR